MKERKQFMNLPKIPCLTGNNFLVLDKDHILFLGKRTTKVFNVTTNSEEFLTPAHFESFQEKGLFDFLFGSNTSLKTSKDGNSYLYCERELGSSFYRRNYYVQILLDVDTLAPALPIYSSLRNSFIDLTDSFTLKDFLEEEIYYIRLVDKFLSELEKTSKMSTRKFLLRSFEEE